jgi:molecular chaperone DnaK
MRNDTRQAPDTVLVVDFGTSLTTATLLTGGEHYPVPDPLEGARSWPSLAYVRENDIVVGAQAVPYRYTDPQNFRAEFKRDIGNTRPYHYGTEGGWKRELTATDLLTALLIQVKEAAQLQVTEPLDRLVITCPGHYQIGEKADRRWADLRHACRQAGFTDVDYLYEPVAASYAAVAGEPFRRDQLVLVYDFGGGTFDLALVRIGDGRNDLVGAAASLEYGGMDIDALLVAELMTFPEIGDLAGSDTLTAWLSTTAREVKHHLSSSETYPVNRGPGIAFDRTFARERLEELVAEKGLISATIDSTRGLLAEYLRDGERPDAILMVGGTSRMPMVERELGKGFDVIRRHPKDRGCPVADGATEWAKRGAERYVLPDQPGPEEIALRWPIPYDLPATVSSWQAEPGDRLQGGDTVVLIQLQDGSICDLRADQPGVLVARHVSDGAEVHSADWLATMLPPHPADPDGFLAPRRWRTIPGNCDVAAFSPDGHFAGAGDGDSVTVYDLADWTRAGSRDCGSRIVQLGFGPDGMLAIVHQSGITLWDIPGDRITELTDHPGGAPRVALSPDGGMLAVSIGRAVELRAVPGLEVLDRQELPFDAASTHGCGDTAFSPDGTLLIPACLNMPAACPDLTYPGGRLRLFAPDSARHIAFRGQSTELIVSCATSPLYLYDIDGPGPGQELFWPGDGVSGLAIDATTGSLLACALAGGQIELRHLDRERLDQVVTFSSGSAVRDLAFTPDGYRLMIASSDHLSIWGLSGTDPAVRRTPRSPAYRAAPPQQVPARQAPASPGPGAGSALPGWLGKVRETLSDRPERWLRTSATDPAEIWRQLHLACCWLDEQDRRQCLRLLREAAPENLPDGYLIPPLTKPEVTGIDWATAAEYPLLASELADWPRHRRDRCEELLQLVGITLTLADNCAGLYTVTGNGGMRTEPLDSDPARIAYREYLLGLVARLAAPDLSPRQEIDWLTEVDQAVRSLFPLPFPSAWSWWASQLKVSSRLLSVRASDISAQAEVLLLQAGEQLSSEQYRKYADKEQNVPFALGSQAQLGTVLWPLRAYVSLPSAPPEPTWIREARVAYGHSHGYTPAS